MPKKQNNIAFIIIAVILVLMVIGTYFYYFVTPKKVNQITAPKTCQPGEIYNTQTGDRCLGDVFVASTTVSF